MQRSSHRNFRHVISLAVLSSVGGLVLAALTGSVLDISSYRLESRVLFFMLVAALAGALFAWRFPGPASKLVRMYPKR